MKLKPSFWIAAAVVLAVVAAVGFYRSASHSAGGQESVALATPTEITIQYTGPLPWNNTTGYDYAGVARQVRAYADAKGMSFYVFDKDTQPGKSACTGDCAKAWPPAVAAADAKPMGDWSLVTRDDGAKQWAYRGKPFYTCAQDEKIGDVKGKGVAGWSLAVFLPAAGIPVPNGIAVQEVGDANGQALVDIRGRTLYAFDGDAKRGKQNCGTGQCADQWTPLTAPELANPVGDFTIVGRDDGIRQWAYKGKPLYNFTGDLEQGDANGIGADKDWHVAMLVRYFMPAEVAVRPTLGFGPILTTADGMSVYWHDAYTYQLGGHGLRHGTPPRPLVGRNIGMKGCDADCLKMWRPVKAPADARPSGYWDVATREDGVKQWVYKGYALYTYAGDKKPGDLTGNDIYDILISQDPNKPADLPSRFTAAGGLVWLHAYP